MNETLPERRSKSNSWVRRRYDQLGGATLTFAWTLLLIGTGLSASLLALGILLALRGQLTGDFIALAGVIQGLWIGLAGIIQALVTLRAAAEDKYVRGNVNGPKPGGG